MLLSGLCALDVCCSTLGLCAFDVNRIGRAALMYVGLYFQSRIVFLVGLCAFGVCWSSLGLCALAVKRTRCAALLYVGNMWSPGLHSCRDYVRAEDWVVCVRR